MRKSKKNYKTTITSNNPFLLALGEFKSDQIFVEKTKLASNLCVENLNHLSRHKSPKNYVQQIILKNNKRKQFFQILTIH